MTLASLAPELSPARFSTGHSSGTRRPSEDTLRLTSLCEVNIVHSADLSSLETEHRSLVPF